MLTLIVVLREDDSIFSPAHTLENNLWLLDHFGYTLRLEHVASLKKTNTSVVNPRGYPRMFPAARS